MAKTRTQKEAILENVKQALSKASVVFVNFHGLSVKDATEMRKTLRESEVSYFVAKKTLVKKALSDQSTEGTLPELTGELALATSDDPVAPAREVYNFAKKHKESVSISGGIFEGAYKNKEEMEEIARIPSLDTLRGMFVNVINSPLAGFAVALNAIAEQKGE